jgi:hypothetical protein
MPGFAKFLAFMNVVIAIAFLVVAKWDYNARRPFAREVFIHELALDGLPLDRHDAGPRRVEIALYQDLDGDILKELFAKVAPQKGVPIPQTQAEEVEYQKKKTIEELNGLKDDEDKRKRILDLALRLAYTLDEREYWLKAVNEDKDDDVKKLQETFIKEFFDRALQEDNVAASQSDSVANRKREANRDNKVDENKDIPTESHSRLTRRQKMAHLLYNLSKEEADHQRAMAAIGLKNYIGEAEAQAARLRDMTLSTNMRMVNERGTFEEQYQQLTQRLNSLLEELEAKKLLFADKDGIKKRTEELVKIRQKDLAELQTDLTKSDKDIKSALDEQTSLEQQVFETQKKLAELQEQTQGLQRYIRRMEGVGSR